MLKLLGVLLEASLAVAAHEANDFFNLLVTEFLFLLDELYIDGFHHLLGLCTFIDLHRDALHRSTGNKVQDFRRSQVLLLEFFVGFFDFIIADLVAAISEHLQHCLAGAVEDAFICKLTYHFYLLQT